MNWAPIYYECAGAVYVVKSSSGQSGDPTRTDSFATIHHLNYLPAFFLLTPLTNLSYGLAQINHTTRETHNTVSIEAQPFRSEGKASLP